MPLSKLYLNQIMSTGTYGTMGCQSGFKVNHQQKFNKSATKLNISDSFSSPSYRLQKPQKQHVASGDSTSSVCAGSDESPSVPAPAGNQGPGSHQT